MIETAEGLLEVSWDPVRKQFDLVVNGGTFHRPLDAIQDVNELLYSGEVIATIPREVFDNLRGPKYDEGKAKPSEVITPDFCHRVGLFSQFLREKHGFCKQGHVEEMLNHLPAVHRTIGVFNAMENGLKKYHRDSWRDVPDGASRYAEAGGRHFLWEWFYNNVPHDKESGLHHFDHAATCFAFYLELTKDA